MTRSPGRPASATRDEVLAEARRRFLRGERLDVQSVAGELGVGRATVYRWFGSREGLLGEVLAREFCGLLELARRRSDSTGGLALLETLDQANRWLVDSEPFRRFFEQEQTIGLRMITSSTGPVQSRVVETIETMIETEMARADYHPPIEPSTLAYSLVRLGEAFLYNDSVVGNRGDVDRLREVHSALLGVTSVVNRA